MRSLAPLVIAVFVASAVLAHEGVKNPAVMARMEAMSAIGDGMKVIGTMVKGARPFDADEARAAAAEIAKQSARTPELFEAEETDPKSEALPAIWADFTDFTAKSDDLEMVALRHADAITSPETLSVALEELGATCQSCHKVYRE